MTDGVLLKEVEKVGRYIVQLVLLGVSIGMLLQSWRITRREFCVWLVVVNVLWKEAREREKEALSHVCGECSFNRGERGVVD